MKLSNSLTAIAFIATIAFSGYASAATQSSNTMTKKMPMPQKPTMSQMQIKQFSVMKGASVFMMESADTLRMWQLQQQAAPNGYLPNGMLSD